MELAPVSVSPLPDRDFLEGTAGINMEYWNKVTFLTLMI